VSGEPAPGPAGTEETCAVGGLPAGEMCYFALRTADEASNWSVLSNLAALVVPGPDEPVSDESPPAPIVDLRVVSQTDTSLTLVWTAVGDDSLAGRAAEYDIRVSESPFAAGAWESARQLEGEPAPAPAGAEETFAITGLLPARTYHVAVRVRDEAGHLSGPSNEAQGTTLPPANSDHVAPEAVTDLTAVAASHDEIVLAWTASGDDGVVGRAAVYDLRHASEPIPPDGWPDADPVPTAPPRLAGEAETLRVSGLPPRSPHYFALTVRDEAGNASGLSNILLAWTAPAPDTLPPAGVEGLVVTETTATSISLAWIAPRDVYPAGADADSIPAAYELRFADAALGPFAWDAAAEAPAPAPQPPGTPVAAVVEGLGPDREYRFAVCARDAAGNPGPISAVVSGRTQVAPPDPPPEDTTPPAAVTTLTGFAAEPGTIRLVWEAVGDDGAVGRAHRYEVRWSLSPALAESWSSSDSLAGAPVPAAAGTWESLDWPGREAGRTYYAALRVHDEAGNASPISNVASIVMPLPGDEAPPSPPTVPAVDFDDAGVALSWSPSPDIDVAGYRVLRRRADLSAPLVLAELVPGTSWLDPSAVAGVLYAYSLRAIDTSGNVSSPTGEVLALVPAEGGETGTLPLVRRVQHFDVLPLSPRDHAVRLQWQVEAGPDLAGVRLYREQLSAGAMDAGPQNAGRDGALETDAHSAASPGSGAPATFVCLSSELLRADGLVGFEDGPVPAAGCYRYWIEAVPVADSAATQWLPPLLVVVPEWGDRWIGVWPNPTAGSVRMLYTRLAAGPATLRLFDAAGRLLGRAERHDGTGRLIWEVPDLEELAPGRLLPGVLFLSLETPVTTHRARVVLVRSR